MHSVDLPALDGRDPLGFLAALGLLRLLNQLGEARLSFSDTTATAVLTSRFASIQEIAEALVGMLNGDGAIIGVHPSLPLKAGVGADPMRRERAEFRTFTTEVTEIDEDFAKGWLPAVVTDLAIDQAERAAITPFMSPRGKQNMRTFFASPLAAVRDRPGYLLEALTGWRRVPGFTGEYFDHRVLCSAADDTEGRTGQEMGVPGATWLATMALPLFRLTGDGERRSATLWRRYDRKTFMIWPLWRPELGVAAVQCLLEHPAFRLRDDRPSVSDLDWGPLDVFGVYGADRQTIPGANFDGVLAPVTIHVRA